MHVATQKGVRILLGLTPLILCVCVHPRRKPAPNFRVEFRYGCRATRPSSTSRPRLKRRVPMGQPRRRSKARNDKPDSAWMSWNTSFRRGFFRAGGRELRANRPHSALTSHAKPRCRRRQRRPIKPAERPTATPAWQRRLGGGLRGAWQPGRPSASAPSGAASGPSSNPIPQSSPQCALGGHLFAS